MARPVEDVCLLSCVGVVLSLSTPTGIFLTAGSCAVDDIVEGPLLVVLVEAVGGGVPMNSHLFLLALNAWLTQLNMAEEWSFEELCCWLAEPDTTHPKTMGQEHFVTVFARRMALIQKLTSHGTMTKDHLDQLFALLARQLP